MPRGVYPRAPLAERFWSKVDMTAGLFGCWPWLGGSQNERGYGRFHLDGRPVPATHVALLLDGRPVPAGSEACHRCDNPPCCNPAHLFSGTHVENIADRNAKGHQARGNRHGSRTRPERVLRGEEVGTSKLTVAQVAEIRTRLTGRRGEQTELAREYGVAVQTIHQLVRGRTWAA